MGEWRPVILLPLTGALMDCCLKIGNESSHTFISGHWGQGWGRARGRGMEQSCLHLLVAASVQGICREPSRMRLTFLQCLPFVVNLSDLGGYGNAFCSDFYYTRK